MRLKFAPNGDVELVNSFVYTSERLGGLTISHITGVREPRQSSTLFRGQTETNISNANIYSMTSLLRLHLLNEQNLRNLLRMNHLDFSDGRDAGEGGSHLGRGRIMVYFLGPMTLETDDKVAVQIGGSRGRGNDLHLACGSYLLDGTRECEQGSDSDGSKLRY